MRIEPDLQTLLSIVELFAIRKNKGHMTLTRCPDGWTVSAGDEIVTGKTLVEALENCIVPVEPKIKYRDWKGENYNDH